MTFLLEDKNGFIKVLSRMLRKYTWWINGFIVLGAAAALVATLVTLTSMENKQLEDFKSLAESIYEQSQDSLLQEQLNNMFGFIKFLDGMPNIHYVAYWVNNKRALETKTVERVSVYFREKPEAEWDGYVENSLVYFSKRMKPALQTLDKQRAKLGIVFSLEAFISKKKLIIQSGIGTTILLLLLVLVVTLLNRTNATLQSTQNKLTEAEQIKSGMISTITHDAKNNLTVINGQIENLMIKQERKLPLDNLETVLKVIRRNAESLTTLIRDFSDNEQLSKGNFAVFPKQCDIMAIVHSVVESMASTVAQNQQEIICDPPGSLGTVRADETRLKQVIQNILSNAMKFAAPQTIIKVKVEKNEKECILRISDQGTGIEQGKWEIIFNSFVRLQPEKVEGTGLGLANSRRFIRLMDGELGVEKSVVGQGTTFYIKLQCLAPAKAERIKEQ
ncbi:HAMP domain-containing histidine kinase [bacterium]|nr:HAMP domain-containing histidine kinase [bacterium]